MTEPNTFPRHRSHLDRFVPRLAARAAGVGMARDGLWPEAGA